MTARYRLVHFVPDPFVGTRIPIGALLDAGRGPSWIQAPHLTDATASGWTRRAAVLELILDSFRDIVSFDRPPASAGPLVRLDTVHEVPTNVGEAEGWITALLAA